MLAWLFVSTVSRASEEPGNWVPGSDWRGYNKNLDGQRYSPLAQINSKNAGLLSEVCRAPIADSGAFEAGLIVVEGTMYATTETDTIALDPATCAVKWRHVYHRSQQPLLALNRGVAYLDGKVFRGTDDDRVIALDAKTGAEVWSDVVGDPQLGEALSGSPVAWNGLVIIGTAVSELGIRGRVMAFDAATGREVWRFHTIPMGDESGAETWKNTNWNEHGGGGTWSTFAIDPVSAELFFSVGNPIPAFTPADRPGTNLFGNCLVVLDAMTGKLKWWYQENPTDAWDHDLSAAPLLFRDSKSRNRIALAGKDGYLHIIDRATHALIAKAVVTTVDTKERIPSIAGVKVCPGVAGGVEWNGPAFDPEHQMLFVGAVDFCSIFRSTPHSEVAVGGSNYGGSWAPTLDPSSGWFTAVDAATGGVKWKYHAEGPVVSGITPTAGAVVFGGDNSGNFLVLDSATGALLKKSATGGALSGGVITYLRHDKQYVAFTSGNTSRSVYGVSGRPTIMVMALPSGGPRGGPARPRVADAAHGRQLYYEKCAMCHGADGKNVSINGSDLTSVRQRMTVEQLMTWIKHPKPPMPTMFADPLKAEEESDLRDIATFVHDWPQ